MGSTPAYLQEASELSDKRAKGDYLVGIDIGTTGAKTIVFDPGGTALGSGYREYACTYPKPNWVEQDSEMLVDRSMESCAEAIHESGIDPSGVAAIAFSTQRTCTHFLDEAGSLVRPMISWQDNRTIDELAVVEEELGGDRFQQITCLPLGAIWIVNKILWLRSKEPRNWERVRKIVQLQDYVLKAYGAEGYFVDNSDAGLYGCWDLYGAEWSQEICRAFDIDVAMLPISTPSGTQVGEVDSRVAARTGLRSGTPICVGAGDQNAAAVGAGLVSAGLMSVSLGTGGLAAAYVEGKLPNLNPQAMLTGHAIEGKYTLEGYQPAGASALRWFRDEIARIEQDQAESSGQHVYDRLTSMAETVPPGAKGLVLSPYFASAGTPRWNANARASVVGLTFAHDRACLVRAFMEGITLEVKDMINSMYACGAVIDEVRILGGPTRSPLWNQIQSDIYGRPVSTLRIPDAAVLGAAICAGVGSGVFSDIREGVRTMVATDKTYDPILENVKVYEELYEVFCDIYTGLSATVYDKLAKIQDRY